MKTTTNRKTEKRNLFITIPDDRKSRLKELAKESKMTMETYVCAVLEEAIASGDIFEFVKKKQESTPALSS